MCSLSLEPIFILTGFWTLSLLAVLQSRPPAALPTHQSHGSFLLSGFFPPSLSSCLSFFISSPPISVLDDDDDDYILLAKQLHPADKRLPLRASLVLMLKERSHLKGKQQQQKHPLYSPLCLMSASETQTPPPVPRCAAPPFQISVCAALTFPPRRLLLRPHSPRE